MKGDAKDKSGMFRSFLDSTRQTTRVSVQMADVGSIRMKQLVEELRPRIDSIFEPADYSVAVTGNSLIFLRAVCSFAREKCLRHIFQPFSVRTAYLQRFRLSEGYP